LTEEPPLPPPPRTGNRTFALRVVVLALAAIVIAEVTMILARGIGCWAMRGTNCPADEWSNGAEMLSSLVATLVALIFALLEGRKP
jgi:hypothetical protein